MTDRHSWRGAFGRLVSQYETEAVFTCGSTRYTREDAIRRLDCANWIAFKKLERLCAKLGVKSLKGLWRIGPQALIRVDGIGTITLYAAMCILDAEGFDVGEWWGWTDKSTAAKTKKRHSHPAPDADDRVSAVH